MDQRFGLKDLIQVSLKAISPFQLGSRQIEAGEPVLYFDQIQLAHLGEKTTSLVSRGGRGARPLIIWDNPGDVRFQMQAGVLSSVGLALLTNSTVLDFVSNESVLVPKQEIVPTNGQGVAKLRYIPAPDSKVFCFRYNNNLLQEKITSFTIEGRDIDLGISNAITNFAVEYYYSYSHPVRLYSLDKDRFSGLFRLEGKFQPKGEIDGITNTILLTIPKVKITSNLNITVGEKISPNVSIFDITALPEKTFYSNYSVLEMIELEDDVG